MYRIEIEKKPRNYQAPSSLSSTIVYDSQYTSLRLSLGANQLVLNITIGGFMLVYIQAWKDTEQYKFLSGVYEEALRKGLDHLKIPSKVHDRNISQALQEFALKEVINDNRNHIGNALNDAYDEGIERGEMKKTMEIRKMLSL